MYMKNDLFQHLKTNVKITLFEGKIYLRENMMSTLL